MIFVSETNLGYDALPTFKDYALIADPSLKSCSHGGIAWYVKHFLAKHIFQVVYNTAFISFRIDIVPDVVFIGVYIQPEGGRYFNVNMFSDLGALLVEYREKGITPFIGGDFNSRPGDLQKLGNNKSWIYERNKDEKTNKHGLTYFKDLCFIGNVQPVNGLKYRGKTFDNDFTFFRQNGKSQIDFCLTNKDGRNMLKEFNIITNDWHLSDHRPITLVLELNMNSCVSSLLQRAFDLNYEHTVKENVCQMRGTYNFDMVRDNLMNIKEIMENKIEERIQEGDVVGAVELLEDCIKSAHKGAKEKRAAQIKTVDMNNANAAFERYLTTLEDRSASDDEINTAFKTYTDARKCVTREIMKMDSDKWVNILKENDAKAFWRFVDWKGNFKNKKSTIAPSITEFEVFFEDLYKCKNQRELIELMEIQSDVTVPLLDDQITEEEIKDAWCDMKKSGYDFQLPVLSILVNYFMLILVNIMNVMFYIKYPISMAYSLLSLIPKKGNLMLPKNFRGIQMMKSLACLFDRIITNRLKLWLPMNVDQTAFQKLKSTLIHIFTLRILIELAKKLDKTLYIGSVDIAKAFDHVPRSLLLKKLVKFGIGKCMLFALKQLYLFTVCILKFQGELSNSFRMERGVRQGAASSVLLFNAYMDGLFDYLDSKCSLEDFLADLHTLIHADDTIILSTMRDTFIKKCNEVINYFHTNGLSLNLDKSAYLIINPKDNDTKTSVILNSGVLKYKSVIEYLGIFLSDTASIIEDVKRFADKKRSNVSFKYTNFCKVNQNAPLHVKLDVLDTCVSSTLTYACETWGRHVNEVDICYRAGLRTALGVRENISNEIVYLESGKWPLVSRIKKAQLKFWLFIQEYSSNNPTSAVAKVLSIASNKNIAYLKYYVSLQSTYTDPMTCQQSIEREYRNNFEQKLRQKHGEDTDSRFGAYVNVNPSLQQLVPRPQLIMEIERILVTRYRTGSHSLSIELGRYTGVERANRVCVCGNFVQSLWHIFFECSLTRDIVETNNMNLAEVFSDEHIHRKLLLISKRLKVRI